MPLLYRHAKTGYYDRAASEFRSAPNYPSRMAGEKMMKASDGLRMASSDIDYEGEMAAVFLLTMQRKAAANRIAAGRPPCTDRQQRMQIKALLHLIGKGGDDADLRSWRRKQDLLEQAAAAGRWRRSRSLELHAGYLAPAL